MWKSFFRFVFLYVSPDFSVRDGRPVSGNQPDGRLCLATLIPPFFPPSSHSQPVGLMDSWRLLYSNNNNNNKKRKNSFTISQSCFSFSSSQHSQVDTRAKELDWKSYLAEILKFNSVCWTTTRPWNCCLTAPRLMLNVNLIHSVMAYRAFCRFFCCQLRLELIFHLWSRSFERNELDWLV